MILRWMWVSLPRWHFLPVQHAAGTKGDNTNSHWSSFSAPLLADYWRGLGPQAVILQRLNVRSNFGQGNWNILCRGFPIYPWMQLIPDDAPDTKDTEGSLPRRWHESPSYAEFCLGIVQCHCHLRKSYRCRSECDLALGIDEWLACQIRPRSCALLHFWNMAISEMYISS